MFVLYLRGSRGEWEERGWRGERESIGGREPLCHLISKRSLCRNEDIFFKRVGF